MIPPPIKFWSTPFLHSGSFPLPQLERRLPVIHFGPQQPTVGDVVISTPAGKRYLLRINPVVPEWVSGCVRLGEVYAFRTHAERARSIISDVIEAPVQPGTALVVEWVR